MSSATDPLLGLRLGNFEIQSVLGRGGMGVVYAAKHLSLPTRAAVKVLLDDFARDTTAVDRFLREAHTASSINDPHIVRIFDAGRLPDGRPYLVMDLLEGQTLTDLLRQGGVDLRRGVEILRQMATAVMVVHDHGILHRDLKPSNVHLGKARGGLELVRVLDFGLARGHGLEHSVTTAPTILGTPLYMSPEQAEAKPVGPESDVYSLGCIAYEVLSGQPPFTGGSVVTIMHQHLTEAPADVRSLRHGLPGSLELIVRRCLAKRPADRPTAKQVAVALEGVLAEIDRTAVEATMAAPSTIPLSPAPTTIPATGPSTVLDPPAGAALAQVAPPTDAAARAATTSNLTPSGQDGPRSAASGVAVAGTLHSVRVPKRRTPTLAIAAGIVAVTGALAVVYVRTRSPSPATGTPAPPPSAAQNPITEEKNPFTVADAPAVEAGRAIWTSHCVRCHGARGDGAGNDIPKGLRPKAFCDVVLQPGTLDVYYFGIVRHGVDRASGAAMPSFQDKLGLKETWQVVTFINTLRPKVHHVDVSGEIAAGPPPDSTELQDRGGELFYTRCSSCHGEEAKGDGPAASLFPIPPPDLKEDAWNPRTLASGDNDVAHVFRIVTLGSGEYMGSFSSLPTKDRWALARYVVGLRRPSTPPVKKSGHH
jgi:eukaryotic-like serine/threonine-protein kinase